MIVEDLLILLGLGDLYLPIPILGPKFLLLLFIEEAKKVKIYYLLHLILGEGSLFREECEFRLFSSILSFFCGAVEGLSLAALF